mmetsp:Transcript_17673/g.29056  ORF Transcript_17673/g.29056 Transcript_17673/m.29056 type:complete len:177 (-) Transcript_17673:1105-1635(-)
MDGLLKYMSPIDSKLDEKISTAYALKDEGNKLFQSQDTTGALQAYHEMFMYIHGLQPQTDVQRSQIQNLKLLHFINVAACHLKLSNWEKAESYCTKALKVDEDNVKALFRRGRARIELADFEDAERDLKRVVELDPEGAKTALAEIQRLRSLRLQNRKEGKEKFTFSFDRQKDEQE